MELYNKAEQYLNQFEIIDRKGEEIVIFKDNASESLKDNVYEAHGEDLPNDWIFNIYYQILQAIVDEGIDNKEQLDEIKHDIIDRLVNIENHKLYDWLKNPIGAEYVDEVLSEGLGNRDNIANVIQTAQYNAINEIFNFIDNLLNS